VRAGLFNNHIPFGQSWNIDQERFMNEIIQRIVDKTGLPEDKANAALDVVMNFLKEKLPPPMASQVDSLMAGGTADAGGIGGMLGGMFGRK
jgi:hypothetical protein